DLLYDIDEVTTVVRPLDIVVVVQDQDRVGAGGAGPGKGIGDPLPVPVGAATDVAVVSGLGVWRGLVHHVNQLGVRVARAELGHPLLHGRLVDRAAGLLAAPDEGVLFEEDLVLFGVIVDGVERGPVEGGT